MSQPEQTQSLLDVYDDKTTCSSNNTTFYDLNNAIIDDSVFENSSLNQGTCDPLKYSDLKRIMIDQIDKTVALRMSKYENVLAEMDCAIKSLHTNMMNSPNNKTKSVNDTCIISTSFTNICESLNRFGNTVDNARTRQKEVMTLVDQTSRTFQEKMLSISDTLDESLKQVTMEEIKTKQDLEMLQMKYSLDIAELKTNVQKCTNEKEFLKNELLKIQENGIKNQTEVFELYEIIETSCKTIIRLRGELQANNVLIPKLCNKIDDLKKTVDAYQKLRGSTKDLVAEKDELENQSKEHSGQIEIPTSNYENNECNQTMNYVVDYYSLPHQIKSNVSMESDESLVESTLNADSICADMKLSSDNIELTDEEETDWTRSSSPFPHTVEKKINSKNVPKTVWTRGNPPVPLTVKKKTDSSDEEETDWTRTNSPVPLTVKKKINSKNVPKTVWTRGNPPVPLTVKKKTDSSDEEETDWTRTNSPVPLTVKEKIDSSDEEETQWTRTNSPVPLTVKKKINSKNVPKTVWTRGNSPVPLTVKKKSDSSDEEETDWTRANSPVPSPECQPKFSK